MNFPKISRLVLAAGLISFGLGLASEKAHAVPISGGIAFQGMFELDGGLGDATAFTSFSNVSVTSGSGSYAGVPVATPVSYAPQPGDPDGGFAFNPLDPSPLSPLWTFTLAGPTDYSFDLISVSVLVQNDFALVLQGTGTAKITGFDDTPGSWNFMSTGFGPTLFEFTNATSVPEGGSTVALLGFSLLGMETLRRKFKAIPGA